MEPYVQLYHDNTRNTLLNEYQLNPTLENMSSKLQTMIFSASSSIKIVNFDSAFVNVGSLGSC